MEEKYTNIKERLLYFAKNQSLGIENFLENIGMTYGSFKGKAKEGSLNSNAIAEIYTKYPLLNIDWLLTGQGSMLKNKEDVSFNAPEIANNKELLSRLERENAMQAKYIASLERENQLLREAKEYHQDKSNTSSIVENVTESKTELSKK